MDTLTSGKTLLPALPAVIRHTIEDSLKESLATAMSVARRVSHDPSPVELQRLANALQAPLAQIDTFAAASYVRWGKVLIFTKDRLPHGLAAGAGLHGHAARRGGRYSRRHGRR